MIRPRKAVERLQKYRPPLEGRAGKLRLDFNENTVGCAPGVVRALRRALNTDWLSRYPEYEEGRAVLAEYFGVSKDEMLISNGVDDAIKLICDTFVAPGDKPVVAPRTLVLVDEAYFDFSGSTVLSWINKFPNLAVSRTFSKAFGLAGLRIGFLFANRELTGLLRRTHAVFAVNSLAVACALEAIQHEDYVRRYAKMVQTNRALLCRRLDRIGVTYAPSAANFVFIRVGSKAPEIARRLREQDILVRDWSYDPHLKGYLRITIGAGAQTRRVIEECERSQHLIETRDGARAWRDLMTYSPTGYFA